MRPKIPYGYRIVNGRAEADPVESRRLHSLFEQFLDGMGVESAAKSAGIDRTPSCCRRMLDNPVYLGTDFYPQIVDAERMEQAVAELARRGAPFKGKKGMPVTEPNPVQTHFAMDRGGMKAGGDPEEWAAQLYGRIRPRKTKSVTTAPANVSGAFSYHETKEDI